VKCFFEAWYVGSTDLSFDVKPGDLVSPKRSEDFIFLHELKRNKVTEETEPIKWSSSDVGLVLEFLPAKRTNEFSWLKILTSSGVGFCCDWEVKNLLHS
jgi:hypothetical protein